MKKLFLILLIALVSSTILTARQAEGIEIMTLSSVAAPFCCTLTTVKIINFVMVSDPAPIWHEQPITWRTGHELFSCPPIPVLTMNRTFCCITLAGNSATSTTTVNGVLCPIMAKSRSFGRIGGYGVLPFMASDDISSCRKPCLDPASCN